MDSKFPAQSKALIRERGHICSFSLNCICLICGTRTPFVSDSRLACTGAGTRRSCWLVQRDKPQPPCCCRDYAGAGACCMAAQRCARGVASRVRYTQAHLCFFVCAALRKTSSSTSKSLKRCGCSAARLARRPAVRLTRRALGWWLVVLCSALLCWVLGIVHCSASGHGPGFER